MMIEAMQFQFIVENIQIDPLLLFHNTIFTKIITSKDLYQPITSKTLIKNKSMPYKYATKNKEMMT
jgi:hypothetical protein